MRPAKKSLKSLRKIHLWSNQKFSLYARLAPSLIHTIRYAISLSSRYFHRLYYEFKIVLPVILFSLLILNLNAPRSIFENTRDQLISDPKDSQGHFTLAQQFFTSNQFAPALDELNLALRNSPPQSPATLKIRQQITVVSQLQHQPDNIRTEIGYWDQIVSLFPHYRDAYIRLAILHWQLYQPFLSRKYFDQALSLDPNNEDLSKMKLLLSS